MTPLLSSDGRSLPRIILGTASVGSVMPDVLVSTGAREHAFRYLDSMLEIGCFAFDIAASYQLGGTERVVGAWSASRRNRDRLFLITKGGHPYPVVEPHRLTPKALSRDLHASLRRLRTERVDLYLLHRDDPTTPLESILESLLSFQRQGDIGAWGVSNWTHDRVRALDALANGAGRVAASSPHFSLAEWTGAPWKGCVSIAGESNRDARAFYEATQLPVFAWSPLGRGFFSTHGSERPDAVYGGAANLARRRRAEELAAKYEVTSSQIALAYLLCHPFPVFAVVATSTAEKMKDNLEAANLKLEPHEIRWLEMGEQG
jgi:aryl-alcohol dehydrogenase-like predicted oxidoreductase